MRKPESPTVRLADAIARPAGDGALPSMRAVERTLRVLAALNRQNGATVTQLAAGTAISRPALYRVLDTLCRLGYVVRPAGHDGYALTPLVRSLADGFHDEDWVRSIATPVITALQERIVWPTDLSTFHGNAMHLRETTRRRSPMTIDRVMIGLRLPMLHSAAGRAYLAWCPDNERELILSNLRASGHPDDARAHDERWVRGLLAGTRRRGYGERLQEVVARTGAIAVPVHADRRVIACLSITFIASALSPQQIARRHLAALSEAAAQIERGLARARPAAGPAARPT